MISLFSMSANSLNKFVLIVHRVLLLSDRALSDRNQVTTTFIDISNLLV